MSKSKFIDKWYKFCQIPEYHYLCDRISAMSDYGLGCPRLEKGYLVRIALFSFYFLGITFKYNDPESVKNKAIIYEREVLSCFKRVSFTIFDFHLWQSMKLYNFTEILRPCVLLSLII